MTFRDTRLSASLMAILLLAGCAGSSTGDREAVFTLPSANPPPAAPPVSQSYVIQRAPDYAIEDLYEIQAAETARQEAENRRLALAALEAQAQRQPTFGQSALAEAEARAAAAEAQASALATELADARAAVAKAEAAAESAETAAQRAVRERVEQLAAEREQRAAQTDRANPTLPERPVLGRFATRPATPPQGAQRAAPPAVEQPVSPAPTRSAPPPAQRPIVEQAPIPGLKPYILARSAIPSAKPRRAAPTRPFRIASAPTLGQPTANTTPTDASITREPGADLSTRFFPTPGKPSTLGTDQDAPLDLVSIDAAPYGVGSELETTVEPDGDTAEWTDAVSLIENGEVEALAINEDTNLVLTLCSGRSIVTTPPDLTAAATLTAPQIICGQNKPLELR